MTWKCCLLDFRFFLPYLGLKLGLSPIIIIIVIIVTCLKKDPSLRVFLTASCFQCRSYCIFICRRILPLSVVTNSHLRLNATRYNKIALTFAPLRNNNLKHRALVLLYTTITRSRIARANTHRKHDRPHYSAATGSQAIHDLAFLTGESLVVF
jgi:hypothetical protein